MSKRHTVFLVLGCLLILCSVCTLLISQLHVQQAQKNAAEISKTICEILPPRHGGVTGTYACMEMPVLQVQGTDFAALLEIPAFGALLPVANTWDPNKITSYPCRFWGSVYDSSLIIGGADQMRQLDFIRDIDHGCVIKIVDMTGAEFVYMVSRIDRSKTAEADILQAGSWDLTLFVRDKYSLDYLIVRCTMS